MEQKTQKLEISKGVQIAAKWWTDRFDGTIPALPVMDDVEEMNEEFESDGDELFEKAMNIFKQVAMETDSKEQYISKEQSKKLRKNIEILLQKSINERGHEWLGTDEDRARGVLGLACFLSQVDHENLLSLPLNVMMHVTADKVDIEYEDFMEQETIYDAKQELILHGKQGQERSL